MLVDIFFAVQSEMLRAALGVVSVLRSQRTHSPAQGRLRALVLDRLTHRAGVLRAK